MSEQPTEKSFAENLNTMFRVRAQAPRPVELELVEVQSYNTSPNARRDMEQFSLFFYGPADIFVPQATYTFDHERMGALDLFIVPIGRDERGFRYEVVFNYFKNGEAVGD